MSTSSVPDHAGTLRLVDGVDARPVQAIGRYMVLAKVGEGRMGQVYAAYDPKLDRRVALKLLGGGGSGEGARAQARLSHPNVVTVHEVDEYDGGPLIATEFVEGQTLEAWGEGDRGDDQEARLVEGLGLLVQAGRGLAAAHGVGLAHRDFRAANVLVGVDERVRVADFGLTGRGREEVSESGVDAREDVFRFCVTAREVLFAEGAGLPHGVETILRKGLSVQPLARYKSMEPLLRDLEGELEALRGPVARPKRRAMWKYIAMGAVLVLAGLGAYRLHIARLTQACVEVGRAVDEVWNAQREAEVVAGLAQTRLGETVALGELVTPWLEKQAQAWRDHARIGCMRGTVEHSLTPLAYDKVQWCLEVGRLELRTLVEALADADELVAQTSIETAAGLSRLEPCLDAGSLAAMVEPPAESMRPALVGVREHLAQAAVLEATGKYEQGLAMARLAREEAMAVGWAPLIAAAWVQESSLLKETGEYAEAEQVGIAGFVEAAKVGAWGVAARGATGLVDVVGNELRRGDEGRFFGQLASVAISYSGDPLGLREADRLENLGVVFGNESRYADALEYSLRSLDICERVLGHEHPSTAVSLHNVGVTYWSTGKYDDALTYQSLALRILLASHGEHHPTVGTVYNALGTVRSARGEYAAAMEAYEVALSIQVSARGLRHAEVATVLGNQGSLLRKMGEKGRAAEVVLRAISIQEEIFGAEDLRTAKSYVRLGQIYRHKPEQARTFYRKALAAQARGELQNLEFLGVLYAELGDLERTLGEFPKALEWYLKGLEVTKVRLGPKHPQVAATLNGLAGVYRKQGAFDDAIAAQTEALAIAERVFEDPHRTLSAMRNNLGALYYEKKDYKTALVLLERSLHGKEARLGPDHESRAITLVSLGNVYAKLGRQAEALTAYTRALNIHTQTSGPASPHTLKTKNAIDRLCTKDHYAPACAP